MSTPGSRTSGSRERRQVRRPDSVRTPVAASLPDRDGPANGRAALPAARRLDRLQLHRRRGLARRARHVPPRRRRPAFGADLAGVPPLTCRERPSETAHRDGRTEKAGVAVALTTPQAWGACRSVGAHATRPERARCAPHRHGCAAAPRPGGFVAVPEAAASVRLAGFGAHSVRVGRTRRAPNARNAPQARLAVLAHPRRVTESGRSDSVRTTVAASVPRHRVST